MISYITELEEIDMQLSSLDKSTPFAIRGVSGTQLSVARYGGGCTFQGKRYTYLPLTDELIRDDVIKWLTAQRKIQKRTNADINASNQQSLL